MQKGRHSSALAVELHLFCIKISISYHSATHRSGTGNGNLSSWKTIIHLYYSCRCFGDAKSQGISKHGLDLLSPQYYEPCTVWVKKLRNSHSHICKIRYHQTFNIRCTKSQNLNVSHLVSHWRQVLSREWRYSWSSAERRFSNYIGVINNFVAY